ncbi:flagellar hook-basal body complex protein FliE [Parvularcula sp. LCG005]|uniref:flagellar hook-basal body complex protein FliE n=1 Tax=Parvularcula sp. LCG005 TaxID=3078805 RepID=UPI00294260E1|nr:flagellar hook-basal body complex protein FliE [Parvularcula sp. LCG005]WOI52944.1 flagellar hook-basal body complex protein FliE [Parvularcula sp. LCG005]
MSITPLNAFAAYDSLAKVKDVEPGPLLQSTENFARMFDQADEAAAGFAIGQFDAQSVVEALSQAEMALQTAVTIRDRVVGAYQELLRMPL